MTLPGNHPRRVNACARDGECVNEEHQAREPASGRSGFGTAHPEPILRAIPAALRRENFPAGSMGPKVEAVCRFIEVTGDIAAIGALGTPPSSSPVRREPRSRPVVTTAARTT